MAVGIAKIATTTEPATQERSHRDCGIGWGRAILRAGGMDLRRLVIVAVWLFAGTGLARADVDLDTLMRSLSQQGFTRMQVSTTLLGRTRIFATSDQFHREIVVNTNTGEILRDFWQVRSESSSRSQAQILDPSGVSDRDDRDDRSGSSGSSGRSGRDDRDDRDSYDDDDDYDDDDRDRDSDREDDD